MSGPTGSDWLVNKLPSPAGLALWFYALAFVILPALLAYKGFAYVTGTVLFAVGMRPHVEALARGSHLDFGFRWGDKHYHKEVDINLKSEQRVVRLTSILLLTFTILILPFLAYALQAQGRLFYEQINTQLPEITVQLSGILKALHQRMPSIVPEVGTVSEGGWQGISSLLSQVTGDAVADLKKGLQELSGSALKVVGTIVGDWLKIVISAIIIGTILANWKKEVTMHRSIIARGIQSEPLRSNVLRYGELYQEGISLFMIGYLEVGLTLSLLYTMALVILPLNLGLGGILFIAIVLGFTTAIPKIGGFIAMFIAALLMATHLAPGLGWFGYVFLSFGQWVDVVIRTVLLLIAAKLFGLLEAYNYTPEIIGERLGMTKMQIIATVVIWAVGAGFFGMIWGILISLGFQAALRLSNEVAEGTRPSVDLSDLGRF